MCTGETLALAEAIYTSYKQAVDMGNQITT